VPRSVIRGTVGIGERRCLLRKLKSIPRDRDIENVDLFGK